MCLTYACVSVLGNVADTFDCSSRHAYLRYNTGEVPFIRGMGSEVGEEGVKWAPPDPSLYAAKGMLHSLYDSC